MHRPTFLILKSMFIDQTHLRRRWCRTCRRRPGTCAAPRWASPSSGRPPSSSTPPLVKACLLGRGWGGVQLANSQPTLPTGLSGLWGRPAPQPYAYQCLEAKLDFRLNYSNANSPYTFYSRFYIYGAYFGGVFWMGTSMPELTRVIVTWFLQPIWKYEF